MAKHRHATSGRPGRRTTVAATAAAVLVVVWAAWELSGAQRPADPSPERIATAAEAAGSPPPPAVPSAPAPRADPTSATAGTPAPSPRVPPGTGSEARVPEPPGVPPPPVRSPGPERERRGPRPEPSAPASVVIAGYSTSQVWESGFQASISLENTSSRPRTVEVVLAFPGGVTLPDPRDCWWDVTCVQSGNTITLTATSPLEPGARRFVGFNAGRRPGSAPFEPLACRVNGSPCEGF